MNLERNQDLPLFNFIGDIDRKVVYNFQLNLNAIYILFTVCKIWGNETPHTEKMATEVAATTTTEIDKNVSKIIANMNKYLTFLM